MKNDDKQRKTMPYSYLSIYIYRNTVHRKTFFLKVLSLSLRVSLSLSSRGRQWIVRVLSFRNIMVMWVCEASEVNIWAVFAVRPNGPNKFVGVILQLCGGILQLCLF